VLQEVLASGCIKPMKAMEPMGVAAKSKQHGLGLDSSSNELEAYFHPWHSPKLRGPMNRMAEWIVEYWSSGMFGKQAKTAIAMD
jgi:hypothetical protein